MAHGDRGDMGCEPAPLLPKDWHVGAPVNARPFPWCCASKRPGWVDWTAKYCEGRAFPWGLLVAGGPGVIVHAPLPVRVSGSQTQNFLQVSKTATPRPGIVAIAA